MLDDARFESDSGRVENRATLAELIEDVTSRQSRQYWLDRLEAYDIPCGPINDYREVRQDPQVRAREMVVETRHPTLGTLSTLGTPIKLSGTPLTPGRPAPLLGQHTDEVLAAAGYGEDEVAALRAAEVVR